MLTNLKLQMYMSYYAFLQAILSVADSLQTTQRHFLRITCF